MTYHKQIAFVILIIGLMLLAFGATRGQAQEAPKAQHASPVAAPTLTADQKTTLLQAEVKVLEDQVAQLQSQLVTAQKAAAFNESRNAFLRQYDDTFKAAGVKSDEFDLDLSTLTFKARSKTGPQK